MKHTEGKWELVPITNKELWITCKQNKIAAMVYPEAEEKEQIANACLIVAAPELLAACKMAENCIALYEQHCRDSNCSHSHCFSAPKMLRAAIAAAKP